MTREPALTCILTHGDGDGAPLARSLRGLLAQPAARVLLVDHAAQPFDAPSLDPRASVIRIARSARATARNRALRAITLRPDADRHWVWVLDPGDTPAPFALRDLSARLATVGDSDAAPDLVFLRGVARRSDGAGPHPGQEPLDRHAAAWAVPEDAAFAPFTRIEAALVAPVAAMRLVRGDLIRRVALRFADDQAGGELQFAVGAVLGAAALARCPVPLFARDSAPPAELSPEHLRDATRALAVMGASALINDPTLRLALVAALVRDLLDRPQPAAPQSQAALTALLQVIGLRADRRVRWSLDAASRRPAEADLASAAPWLAQTMAAFASRVRTAPPSVSPADPARSDGP